MLISGGELERRGEKRKGARERDERKEERREQRIEDRGSRRENVVLLGAGTDLVGVDRRAAKGLEAVSDDPKHLHVVWSVRAVVSRLEICHSAGGASGGCRGGSGGSSGGGGGVVVVVT